MRKRLAAGGEIARQVLHELFPRAIWLQPDDSGRFLWAEFDDGLRAALFDELAGIQYSSAETFPLVGKSVCVVAGACSGATQEVSCASATPVSCSKTCSRPR
jgi:DNA-binding transcriptional MocR family regulator